MLTLAVALACLAVTTVGANFVSGRDGYLSPPLVVAVSILFYGVALPIEFALLGRSTLGTRSGLLVLPDTVGPHVSSLALLAIIAVFAGYLLTRGRRTVSSASSLPFLRHTTQAMAMTTAILMVALIATFPRYLLEASNYQTGSINNSTSPTYSLLVRSTYQSYAMTVVCIFARERIRFTGLLLLACPLFLWGVYSNDKDPMLVGALVLGSSLFGSPSEKKRPVVLSLAIASSVALLALSTVAFSVYRGSGSLNFLAYARRTGGLLNRVEPAGPFFTISDTLASPPPREFGWTLVEGLFLWIPRFIWPERPMDLAQQFARDHIANWSLGQGYGYSLLSEGLVNGGALGVAGVFLVFGAMLGWIWREPADASNWRRSSLWRSWRYVVLLFVCFVSMRGPFSLIVTNIVQSGVILGIGGLFVLLARGIARQADRLGGPRGGSAIRRGA